MLDDKDVLIAWYEGQIVALKWNYKFHIKLHDKQTPEEIIVPLRIGRFENLEFISLLIQSIYQCKTFTEQFQSMLLPLPIQSVFRLVLLLVRNSFIRSYKQTCISTSSFLPTFDFLRCIGYTRRMNL